IGLAEEAHISISDESFGSEGSNELNVRIDHQSCIVLRRGNRSQLDHLLQDPTPYRWKWSSKVDRQIDEWHAHKRARQEVHLTADMRSRAAEPAEQLEIRPRHDNVMLNRVWRINEHRSVQCRAQFKIR